MATEAVASSQTVEAQVAPKAPEVTFLNTAHAADIVNVLNMTNKAQPAQARKVDWKPEFSFNYEMAGGKKTMKMKLLSLGGKDAAIYQNIDINIPDGNKSVGEVFNDTLVPIVEEIVVGDKVYHAITFPTSAPFTILLYKEGTMPSPVEAKAKTQKGDNTQAKVILPPGGEAEAVIKN